MKSNIRNYKRIFLLNLFPVLCLSQTVTLSNTSWDIIMGAANLTGGAGTYFVDYLVGPANTVGINVSHLNIPSPFSIRLDVSRTMAGWPGSWDLRIRRTGDGGGSGGISGGTTYLLVDGSTRQFCTFTSVGFWFLNWVNRTNIPVQYRLEGLSNLQTGGTYTTTLTYTVTAY